MCTVSMIGDYYRDRWIPQIPPTNPHPNNIPPIVERIIVSPSEITKEEFEELKREVLEMKELLKRAKKYDEDTGQPDCEMDDKVELLKRIAEAVGVDLSEIFGKKTKKSVKRV